MITLGVDFAAQPKNTALCQMHWQHDRAEVDLLERNVSDQRILSLSETAHKVGLDVPFGWPLAFVKSISAHGEGAPWPENSSRELCYRQTDRFIHSVTGHWPLSVSTDRIGITAFRAASILSRLGRAGDVVDRTGKGKFVEIYPAAAARVWTLGPCSKKDSVTLAKALWERCKQWLHVPDDLRTLCEENRHALDALIAALVVRASALKLCEPISAAGAQAAEAEGWIALPLPGSLDMLA